MTPQCDWASCDKPAVTAEGGWLHCRKHKALHLLYEAEENGRPTARNGKPMAVCGTVPGWAKHRRRKEAVCDSCREAKRLESAYYRELKREAS